MTGLASPAHIVVLLVVLLLVFGAKRLPELGRSLGTGMREFKHSVGAEPGEEPAMLAAVPEPVAPSSTVPIPAATPASVESAATRPAA